MATAKKYYTREEIVRKIELEQDLEDEGFVRPEELYGYLSEAVSEVEKIVHTLYEDYFLTRSTLIPFIDGVDEYALPDDIFIHKIRGVYFNSGSSAPTEIKRIRDWKKLSSYTDTRYNQPDPLNSYSYFLINSTPGEPKFLFSPVPKALGGFTVWYLRNANKMELDTDILDIPEALGFICQYVKVRVYEKEVGHPNLSKSIQDLIVFKEQFESTLRDMIPDNDTTLEMDTSIYEEMS